MAEALGSAVRARLTRVLVVLAVAAGVVVIAFGSGYRASQAVVDDGSAWLVKGRTVAHVNGETGRSDAEVALDLGSGGERLEVVQTPSGHVYVVNDETGTVTRVDLTGMEAAAERTGTPGEMQVLGSGRDTYYVDRGRGSVQLVDPDTMKVSRDVTVPAGVSAAVADRSGSLWVLDDAGTLQHIEDGAITSAVEVGHTQKLSLVDGRPLLVDAANGSVSIVEDDEVREVTAGLPTEARLELNQPSTRGGTAWLADEDSGTLLGVDLAGGRVQTIPLGSSERADLGPAVTLGGLVYVPDYTAHRVRVVDVSRGRLARTIGVVGTSRTFELFVEDGRVWINDPQARSARVLDAQGRATTVDKGEGHGVADPELADPAVAQPSLPSSPPGASQQTPGGPPASGGSDQPGEGAEPARSPSPEHDDPGGPDPAAPAPSDPPPADPGGPGPAAQATVAVPDVVGRPRDEACATLGGAGLGCSPQGIGSRPGVPPDQVVASSPGASEQVAPGTIVTVQYAGATTVPDLAGRTPAEACDQLLRPAGLACGPEPLGTAGDADPLDTVVRQDPPANQQVGGGTTVTYGFYDRFTVASYVGGDPDQACQSLAARPIQCEKVDLGPTPRGQRPDVVMTQSLAPGDYGPGQTLRLDHYTGAERGDPMPNVVGQPAGSVCGPVAQAGYDCVVVEHPTPSRQVGVALSQSQAPGAVLPLGTRVEVTQETNVASEVCRYRKAANEDVWLLRIGCGTSGIETWQQLSSLGFAFADNQGAQPGTVQLFDNNCCDGAFSNHQITPGGPNPDAGWQNSNSTVGRMFTQDFGGMQEIVRMIRTEADGVNDYAYAIRGQESYSSQGFTVEQSLGWVWTQ